MCALFSCFISLQADNAVAYHRLRPYHVQDVVEVVKVCGTTCILHVNDL